jgi:hypothetical protein
VTEEEANHLLHSSEALVRIGQGICNRKTYQQIACALVPTQSIRDRDNQGWFRFSGVVLHVSDLIPDGAVWPFEPWYKRCACDIHCGETVVRDIRNDA